MASERLRNVALGAVSLALLGGWVNSVYNRAISGEYFPEDTGPKALEPTSADFGVEAVVDNETIGGCVEISRTHPNTFRAVKTLGNPSEIVFFDNFGSEQKVYLTNLLENEAGGDKWIDRATGRSLRNVHPGDLVCTK